MNILLINYNLDYADTREMIWTWPRFMKSSRTRFLKIWSREELCCTGAGVTAMSVVPGKILGRNQNNEAPNHHLLITMYQEPRWPCSESHLETLSHNFQVYKFHLQWSEASFFNLSLFSFISSDGWRKCLTSKLWYATVKSTIQRVTKHTRLVVVREGGVFVFLIPDLAAGARPANTRPVLAKEAICGGAPLGGVVDTGLRVGRGHAPPVAHDQVGQGLVSRNIAPVLWAGTGPGREPARVITGCITGVLIVLI